MKPYILSLFLLSLLLGTGCKDSYFDTSPSGDLTGNEAFATTQNIDALMNGTLRYLMESSTSQDNPGFAAIMLTSEVMGEDAIARDGVYGFRDSYPYRDPYDNTTRRALFFWTLLYKVIDNSNLIIQQADQAKGTEKEKDHLKGQAYALRAFAYFNLVQHYQFTYAKDKEALAVPLYTEPTTPHSEAKKKSSVAEIYNQIEQDLNQAETLLADFQRKVKNRLDLSVVNGLQARVYLVTQQWQKAAEKAEAARVKYPLMTPTEWQSGFNDVSNQEWIWGHPQQADQNLGGASFFGYIDVTPSTGYRSIMPDPYFWQLFEENDIRKELFTFEGNPSEPTYRWFKFKKFINKTDRSGHIVLMRGAEQLLIQAEALTRLGNLTDALGLLNELREKRGLSPLLISSFSQEELLEEVLRERRKELWGEGFRLTDVLRLQQAVQRKESTLTYPLGDTELLIKGHYIWTFPDQTPLVPNSPFYLFSIPVNEINNNPNL